MRCPRACTGWELILVLPSALPTGLVAPWTIWRTEWGDSWGMWNSSNSGDSMILLALEFTWNIERIRFHAGVFSNISISVCSFWVISILGIVMCVLDTGRTAHTQCVWYDIHWFHSQHYPEWANQFSLKFPVFSYEFLLPLPFFTLSPHNYQHFSC